MEEMPQPCPPKRWPWALAILLVIAVDALLLGFGTGECIDYTAESGAASTCTSGPALGSEGMWVLAAASVLVIGYLARRLARAAWRRRPQLIDSGP
ncbi:hypothetical protein SAMN05660473_02968 [Arthrobacter sp. 49Tsu3.1M3]|uniref:hypothetical protein n=1 Tax=Arthrobacter sp. 49Tsu3.1M3 TaxID=1279029 RepID=UPI0009D077F5|nr:hypothetical protein [Arthrobacter sp. 49Tsu3.1M3]SKB90554.1 hypothetical protein SAMN05660473_02968 [Arthrobacter sp. 49Tsu3.1M3]